jgi:Domain of unknown function (DUF4136)
MPRPVLAPRLLRLAASLAALLALEGCSVLRRVSVDRDPAVPLPAGATWAYRTHAEPEGPEADALVDNPIVHQRLERLVAGQLEARGYHQVADPSQASLLVDYHLGIREHKETVRTVRRSGAYAPITTCDPRQRTCTTKLVWGPYGPPEVSTRHYVYREGTLVVDVADRASGLVAWRVVGERRMSANDGTEDKLRRVVERLLRDLPASQPPSR